MRVWLRLSFLNVFILQPCRIEKGAGGAKGELAMRNKLADVRREGESSRLWLQRDAAELCSV